MARQFVKQLEPFLGFEIECHAFLVAAEREEIGAHAFAGIIVGMFQQAPRALPFSGRLDLDGARAHIGEQHGAIRARQHMREIENDEAFKRAHRYRR